MTFDTKHHNVGGIAARNAGWTGQPILHDVPSVCEVTQRHWRHLPDGRALYWNWKPHHVRFKSGHILNIIINLVNFCSYGFLEGIWYLDIVHRGHVPKASCQQQQQLLSSADSSEDVDGQIQDTLDMAESRNEDDREEAELKRMQKRWANTELLKSKTKLFLNIIYLLYYIEFHRCGRVLHNKV